MMKSPFPYFGGKSRVATEVWQRFDDVRNYVEPFAGSLAVLLARPEPFSGSETVNDADGMLSNFWRATKHDPQAVARHADWPVNENDLHARHAWLVGKRDRITAKLEGDPDWYCAKAAGWWVWGLCCWIGRDWCSGKGPWRPVAQVDGSTELVRCEGEGQGVNRQRPHLGNASQGVNRPGDDLAEYFQALADRLRRTRVCSGDWARVCGPTPTTYLGLTAVFLDPPYADTANRDPAIYTCESAMVAHDVRRWALEHGDDPLMRIALCGYEGEHEMPDSWTCHAWKANGGYGSQSGKHDNPNARRERIWFSPHCISPASQWDQSEVFALASA